MNKEIELEQKARNMATCPKCGDSKEAGEHSQIVCWGSCWRAKTDGLKYTNLSTYEWLKKYTNLK